MIRSFRLPNGKELLTPKIFLTYTNVEYGMKVKPWEYMKVPGLLFPLNFVYPLVEGGVINQSLKEFLDINEDVITFLDCNLRYAPHEKRFYTINIHRNLTSLLRGPRIENINVDRIKETISLLEPDLTSIPYYPIKFTDSTSEITRVSEANGKLLIEFLNNFGELKQFCPVPVIQVGIRENVEDKINEITKVLKDLGLEEHIFIAYGSHVGFPYRPVKQVKPDFINIKKIRQTLGDNYYLHVFGVGSYTLVPSCIYLGADSVDSTLWSAKAGRKEILVPNVGARSLRGRKNKRQFLSEEESRISCDCPICEGKTIGDMRNTFLDDLIKGRLHNAWIQIKDIKVIIEAIKQNNLHTICQERIKVKSLLEVLQATRLNKFM